MVVLGYNGKIQKIASETGKIYKTVFQGSVARLCCKAALQGSVARHGCKASFERIVPK